MESKNLLVIDNDFDEYDTHGALDKSIEKLKREGVEWKYSITQQGFYLAALSKESWDAIILDNDFGEGLETAHLIRRKYEKIPILYISAYGRIGLKMQCERLAERGMINGRAILGLTHPDDFGGFGIEHVQKRGKNVSKDIGIESLEEGVYSFLKKVK